jgi:hypothetical protein
MVGSSFILPWITKTSLITGLTGANFEQTDVSQCQVIHRDTLIGCEDLHVYNAPSGPMIFTGCVEKISDQFVSPKVELRANGRLGFQGLLLGIRVERGFTRLPFMFMSLRRIKLPF